MLRVWLVHLHRHVISELTSSQSFQDSPISCFPELHDICHQICLSVDNKQENKMSNKADGVRDETGDDPIALLLVCPLIYRFAYIKPVLAASAGVGSKTGSGATPRSSNQPPGPSRALGDIKDTVYTEEAKFSF